MVGLRRFAFLTLCGALSYAPVAAAGELNTDANIITGLDVSSSINAQETMLQIDGMAEAIRSPAILAAIQRGQHGRIGFAVFIWADGDFPELVSWRTIGSVEDAQATSKEISARLASLLKSPSRSVGTLTDVSGAMEHASQMLQNAPYAADRAVVNIIGNGEDNVGEGPQRARAELVARGATINGVVVGGDKDVLNYYRKEIIGGRTAFVLPADDAKTLVQVFAMKFVTEIALNVQTAVQQDQQ